jgi:hypothetical protein
MPLYHSLKALPELRGRSAKERRQVMCQMGFAPYRSWQVWLTLAFASLALLWMGETVVGNALLNKALSAPKLAFYAWIAGPLIVAWYPALAFRDAYLDALRPRLVHVAFDPQAGWWRTWPKATLKGLAAVPLVLCLMAVFDWTINSFDARPSPRIAEIMAWPQPAPPDSNGFIAFAGLEEAPGAAPFAAGQAWLARADEAARRQPLAPPEPLDTLRFVEFDAVPAGRAQAPRAPGWSFCRPGKESCLGNVQSDPKRIGAWIAANQTLLARYQALFAYPHWQFTVSPGMVVIPPYSPLIRGQSLLHASALLAVQQHRMGQAVHLMGREMRFARTMLAGQNPLIGKMIAAALLANDLAIVNELVQNRAEELAPYRHDLERMLQPLTVDMVSSADTFRFEEKWALTILEHDPDDLAGDDIDSTLWANPWIRHHFRPVATANAQISFMDRVVGRMALLDAGTTPLLRGETVPDTGDLSRLVGFMHNQAGKWLLLASPADYLSYANRLYELNALNNFVHLRMALAADKVTAQDLPAYVERSGSGLRNPETGKPFDWDAGLRRASFTPGTHAFQTQFPRDAAGRIAFVLPRS